MATVTITPELDSVVGEIFIAAPPERVFQALTDPKQVPQWWGQQGLVPHHRMEGRCSAGRQMVERRASATMAHRFAWTANIWKSIRLACWSIPGFASYRDGKSTVVRWELEPRSVHGLQHRGPQKVGTGTLVKIRQEGFAGAPESARGHAEGWTRVLGWMQAFVENGATIDTRKAS